MTETIIRKITTAMGEDLTPEQLKRLENILTKELADFEHYMINT